MFFNMCTSDGGHIGTCLSYYFKQMQTIPRFTETVNQVDALCRFEWTG